MNLTLSDILRYSPYDYKTDLKGAGYNENFFIENFLVDDIQIFKDEYEVFELALNRTKSDFHPYIILSGYSGCGKTTLINYLARKLKDNYDHSFTIVNLTSNSNEIGIDLDILKNTLRQQLNTLLRQSHNSLRIVKDHLNDVLGFTDDTNIENGLVKVLSLAAVYDKKDSNSEQDFFREIKLFVSNLSLKEILFFFMFEEVLVFNDTLIQKYGTHHSSQKIVETKVICFDNMDEINIQVLTKEFWKELNAGLAMLTNVCRNDAIGLNIDTSKFISIVLTFRESNISLYNSQLKDRLSPFKLQRRLILDGDVEKILKKRIDFIKNNDKSFSNEESSYLYSLIKIFNNDNDWIRKAVFPLFNFDYRKYFEFLPSLIRQNTGGPDSFNYSLDYKEYMSIYHKNKTIARGVMYSYLIDFAFKTYFDRYLLSPEDSCNKYRMLLTCMFNLAYPDGLDDNTSSRNKKRPRNFKLKTLIDIADVFTENEIIEMTKSFFPQEESSFAQWIIIYDSDIALLGKFDYNLIISKSPIDYTDDEKKFMALISKSEIYFNASAFAYLRYIVTHFEYFCYLLRKDNNEIKVAPLALQSNITFANTKSRKDKKKSAAIGNTLTNIPCFEFEKVINLVLDLVVRKKNYIENYYCNFFYDDFPNESEYSKSVWAFGENSSKRSFYINKVLFTHINYIDNFRFYAWYSDEFNQKLDEVRGKIPLKSKSQIQDFLLGTIEKYIEQCNLVKYRDSMHEETIKKISETIKKIYTYKNSSTGEYHFPTNQEEWISVEVSN